MKPRVFWTIYDEKPGGKLVEHDTFDMTKLVFAVLRNIGLDPVGFLGLPRAARVDILNDITAGKVRMDTVDTARAAGSPRPQRPTIHARVRSRFIVSRYDEDETGELVYVSAQQLTHAQLLRFLSVGIDEFDDLPAALQERFLERLGEGMTPAAAKEIIHGLTDAVN